MIYIKKYLNLNLQNYDMTMQEFKVIFWWEWAHRFLGRLIGISFLIPLIYFTFKIKFKKLLSLIFHIFINLFSRIYWMVYGKQWS